MNVTLPSLSCGWVGRTIYQKRDILYRSNLKYQGWGADGCEGGFKNIFLRPKNPIFSGLKFVLPGVKIYLLDTKFMRAEYRFMKDYKYLAGLTFGSASHQRWRHTKIGYTFKRLNRIRIRNVRTGRLCNIAQN